jgi:hypothetical protein
MNPLQLRNNAKTNVQSNTTQKTTSPTGLVSEGFFKPGADAIENITKQAGNDNTPVNKTGPNGVERSASPIPALKKRPGETASPPQPTETTTRGPFGVETNPTNKSPAAVGAETAATIPKGIAESLGGQAQLKPEVTEKAANDNSRSEPRRFRDEPTPPGTQGEEENPANSVKGKNENLPEQKKKSKVKFPMLMFCFAAVFDSVTLILGLFGVACSIFGVLPALGVVFLIMGIIATVMTGILRTVFSFVIFDWSKVYQLENYAKAGRAGKLKKMMTAGPAAVVKQVIFWVGMIPYIGIFIPSLTIKVILTYKLEKSTRK